ncbi:MAG: hypothetical protein K2X01_11765 [Cyanobacteria bacterium]|nr:hypothetical protein [Cyanobacteriota bacterium]
MDIQPTGIQSGQNGQDPRLKNNQGRRAHGQHGHHPHGPHGQKPGQGPEGNKPKQSPYNDDLVARGLTPQGSAEKDLAAIEAFDRAKEARERRTQDQQQQQGANPFAVNAALNAGLFGNNPAAQQNNQAQNLGFQPRLSLVG